ncbi:MAG: hypothetical protein WBC33_06850 [Conexibacter sp.]
MTTTGRNVLIVLALAAIVMLVPGGGNASSGILELLLIAMLGSIGWLAVRLYREHRVDIYGLGERNRAFLYLAIGLATLTLTATDRLWSTGAGSVVWIALMVLAGYGVFAVLRAARRY